MRFLLLSHQMLYDVPSFFCTHHMLLTLSISFLSWYLDESRPDSDPRQVLVVQAAAV